MALSPLLKNYLKRRRIFMPFETFAPV